MRAIDREEFKKISLSLLDAFVSVCEENDLRYCIDYGTLLGAVRHQGFIPWDDDIDVTMPRSDYNALCALAMENENIFGEGYHLAVPGGRYFVQKPFANLVDSRTLTASEFRSEKYYYPIWIDIFPMDYAIEDDRRLEEIIDKVDLMKRRAKRPIRRQTGRQKLLLKAYALVFSPFIESRMQKVDRYIQQFPPSSRYISFLAARYRMKDIVPTTYFDDRQYAEFEGKRYRIPKEFDQRLTELYGDYMTLPPEEERITHSIAAYYLDTNESDKMQEDR